ncbi:TVP38/TMEM64 family protein [Paenibacillus eucommiae]|uniref:TVP38/TMEM64 family protein n=1 Tax=Paenibacillus eucommiae TaxID=1355755 RepID=UPI001FD8F693|nr:TVP38/TMEM64 family protein [Paenibacillus eucommiae]
MIILVVLVLLVVLIHFLFFTRNGVRLTHSNMHQLTAYIESLGWYGKIIGMVAVFLQTFFPFIPFVLVAGTNVAIFGFKLGFIVNYSMSVLGAVCCFLFARYYGHGWVERRLQRFPVITQFSKRMESQGFFYVLLGRLIPVIPSSAINLAAGLTRIKVSQFLWGTIIGKIPIVFLESMIAHDLFHFRKYKDRLLLLLLILVILLLIGNWFKKRLASKAQDEER